MCNCHNKNKKEYQDFQLLKMFVTQFVCDNGLFVQILVRELVELSYLFCAACTFMPESSLGVCKTRKSQYLEESLF